MKRVLAIDYGTKKCGIAVTDPLQIIATGLDTIATKDLFRFLKEYSSKEDLECFVVGEPFFLDGSPAQHHQKVLDFITQLKKEFPTIPVYLQDETNTSEKARKTILQSGAPRKKRQNKNLVDKVAAVLILQDWMEENRIT